MEKQREFVPEITVNNSKVMKLVEIEGKQQEVEVPAQEGFNIKTRDLDGNYDKKFFVKDLDGIILLDRYQIQSKYSEKPMYMSNEFEFQGPRNALRVYCPESKTVIYEGDYQGAIQHFATGQTTDFGKPEKTFDVFSILYFLIGDDIFRFRWKMNQNNSWFKYKDGCKEDPQSREDKKEYRSKLTKFALEKKKFGTNDFWVCSLQNVGDQEQAPIDAIADALEERLDGKGESVRVTTKDEEIKVEEPGSLIDQDMVQDGELEITNIPF